nr:MAG: hypothetical protein 1 [Solemoviridae sp.]
MLLSYNSLGNIMYKLHLYVRAIKRYSYMYHVEIVCALTLFVAFVSFVVILLPLMVRKIRKSMRIRSKADGKWKRSFQEKMIPGSDFQLNVVEPGFQAAIYGVIGDSKPFPVGQGFWIDEGFITAAHVVQDLDEVVLSKNGVKLFYYRDDFVTLDGDMAILKVTAAQTQKLGLSKGKLSPTAITPNGGLIAQIVAFGKRSAGFVDVYPQFGYCKFGGSTIGGFSGAPYYLNKQIFGMHLGGNLDNIGYEAAYMRSVLRPSKTVRNSASYDPEDSDDWLIEQANRFVDFSYDQNPYDPDEFRVKINNRYHMVSYEVLNEMRKAGKGRQRKDIVLDEEKMDVESLPLCPRGALNFKDSGNLLRAPAVIAGAHGKEPVQVFAPNQGLQTSSTMASTSPIPLEPSHMESLTSTPVQRNVPSRTTVRKQKMRLRNQQLTSIVEQLSRRLEAMENGASISEQRPLSISGSKTNSDGR